MNKEKFIKGLKHELLNAFNYFQAPFIISFQLTKEIDSFFISIKDMELDKILYELNNKYGWILNHYREIKRNAEISTIKKISKFFLIITIISIIIGVIIGISIATS